MIVECSSNGDLYLAEPEDFRNFTLLVKSPGGDNSPLISGISFVDGGNALISIDLVPALPGRPEGDSWQRKYFAMIETARKHGWIDAHANAIRAHVERSDLIIERKIV